MLVSYPFNSEEVRIHINDEASDAVRAQTPIFLSKETINRGVYAMHTQARVVIISGRSLGVSLAYHLTKECWNDILLLEKGELTRIN
ncbi:MAG: hypothetical protein ACI9CE_001203 [Flavobacterium sp.]